MQSAVMYNNRKSDGSSDESPQRSTRSTRTLRSTNANSNSSAHCLNQLSQPASRSGSIDSDRSFSSRNMVRGNSPQPGPSRLMRKILKNDASKYKSNRKIPNSGNVNLSDSDSDESEPSTIAHDGDSNNGMDDSFISDQEQEMLIGPNSFTFNAETPLKTFGETITKGLIKEGKTANHQSKKFIFSEAEMPKTKAELRRKYSHLIEKCQGFEDNDADFNLQELLSENIAKGTQLFEVIGGGPGDMYMAFLHTKMCSGMLKHTVDMIGNSSSVFKKDIFIDAVKNWSFQETEAQRYLPQSAISVISMVASECCVTVPHMVAMVGACNRDRISAPPKQKKPRAAPKRKIFDTNSALATQYEELNAVVGQKDGSKKTRAEIVSQEISSVLKNRHKETGRPSPFFDFTMAKSCLAETVEHIFYTGFLIRDGFASLAFQRRVKRRKSRANLVILPAEPPQKKKTPPTAGAGDHRGDEVTRNQYILSFTPMMWKALVRASRGEDTINLCKPKLPKPK